MIKRDKNKTESKLNGKDMITEENTATNGSMISRLIFFFIFLAVAFVCCLIPLIKIQLVNGEYYKQKAESQQLSDIKVPAKRGTIFDTNLNVLAQSATSWRIYLDPRALKGDESKPEDKLPDDALDVVVTNLASILDMDEETIRQKATANSGYEILKIKVDSTVKAKVEDFIYSKDYTNYKLVNIIGISQDAKRYYPNSTLASTVIGFTGTDDQGLGGLESFYDKYLKGTAGRVITAVNGVRGEMPNSYETVIDAQQGYSLVLTVDQTLQYYLEKNLEEAMIETKSKGAYGIIMKVDTGEILAMSSKPDYDSNQPWTVVDETLLKKIEELEEGECDDAISAAVNEQWRNHAISDTYQPGSVFKIITASAALEEGVVTTEDHFDCPGYIVVAGRRINCHKLSGHGHQTFTEGLMNSCNPCFISVGLKLGTETFMQYFKAFGLDDKTGIDLPGEANSITHEKLGIKMGISELASCAFGQTFQITPIQMITAVAAVANGGKLMQPYIVKSIVDENGNTVSKTEPTVRRQVISEETASTLCEMLEKVVAEGTGKNAYVAGYRIAGKTGTSEKIGEVDENGNMQYIASFIGFAPANDPQIIALVILDEPRGSSHTGGVIAAPLAGRILSESLEYLNVELQYTDEELENLRAYVLSTVGTNVDNAKQRLRAAGFNVKIIGSGDTVVSQTPSAYAMISKGGTVVLYTDDSEPRMVEVPDLTGYSVSQVNSILGNLELNLIVNGSSMDSGEIVAYGQSIEKGTKVKIGTAVTVTFVHTTGVDDF